jgi:hypothetical protein
MVLEELDGNIGGGEGEARAGSGKNRIEDGAHRRGAALSSTDVSARRGTVFGAVVVRATKKLQPIKGRRGNQRRATAGDVYASELIVQVETSPAARKAATRLRARGEEIKRAMGPEKLQANAVNGMFVPKNAKMCVLGRYDPVDERRRVMNDSVKLEPKFIDVSTGVNVYDVAGPSMFFFSARVRDKSYDDCYVVVDVLDERVCVTVSAWTFINQYAFIDVYPPEAAPGSFPKAHEFISTFGESAFDLSIASVTDFINELNTVETVMVWGGVRTEARAVEDHGKLGLDRVVKLIDSRLKVFAMHHPMWWLKAKGGAATSARSADEDLSAFARPASIKPSERSYERWVAYFTSGDEEEATMAVEAVRQGRILGGKNSQGHMSVNDAIESRVAVILQLFPERSREDVIPEARLLSQEPMSREDYEMLVNKQRRIAGGKGGEKSLKPDQYNVMTPTQMKTFMGYVNTTKCSPNQRVLILAALEQGFVRRKGYSIILIKEDNDVIFVADNLTLAAERLADGTDVGARLRQLNLSPVVQRANLESKARARRANATGNAKTGKSFKNAARYVAMVPADVNALVERLHKHFTGESNEQERRLKRATMAIREGFVRQCISGGRNRMFVLVLERNKPTEEADAVYYLADRTEAARRLLTDELQGILERVVPQTSGA